jgi:hypothetical protein
MRWRKLGHVYSATGDVAWARSHAYLPTPLLLDRNRIRVYTAFLDAESVGRVGYVDVAADDPRRVLDVSREPLLDVGRPGAFDENGVNPLSIVRKDGVLYLYYIGWQRGLSVRYYLFTGLATSRDNGSTFRRVSEAPVLDRSNGELFVRSGTFAMCDEGTWRMWYAAANRWIEVQGKPTPTYDLRSLESSDPARWGAAGEVCLEPIAPDEFGFGRPFVRRTAGGYQMWLSVRTRSRGYRLGFAESADGRAWRRRGEVAGLDVSPGGWDSDMVCFPALLDVADKTYMFYNGNGYGQTGFGVALRED